MPDERTEPMRVEVLALPWNSLSRTTPEGYRERIMRGAVDPSAFVGLPAIDAHRGTAIGVVEDARDTRDGIVTTLRLSDIARSRDLYTLAADGALGASVAFEADAKDARVERDGTVTRSALTPVEVSLTPTPAYERARVLLTREAYAMPDEVTTEHTEQAQPATVTTTTEAAPVERSARPTAPVTHYATADEVEALRARLDAAPRGTHERTAHPLSAFPSFGAFALAVYRGEVDPAHVRAWANQTTPDNPGVMPPSWATEVHGIVAQSRPMVEGTGGAVSPGATGMEAAWAYFDGDLSALIAAQAADKTEVNSVKVSLKKGTTDLTTYAGGSDIAVQVIERSSPSYLDAYFRVMSAAYALVTEQAYQAALVAGGVTTPGLTIAGLYAAVINASAEVADATGQAPSVIGITADLWGSIAGAVDSDGRPVYPPLNPTNAPGSPTGPGATGGISIAGIPAFRIKGAGTGKVVLTNGTASRFMEDGPRTLSADDVPLLGRDVAVYGYGSPALYIPAGVRVLSTAASRKA